MNEIGMGMCSCCGTRGEETLCVLVTHNGMVLTAKCRWCARAEFDALARAEIKAWLAGAADLEPRPDWGALDAQSIEDEIQFAAEDAVLRAMGCFY